jgi:hypothetical protein
LKHLKKTLFLPESYDEKNKQANPIEIHQEDIQTSPKKNHG